jgi:hypothetical protein
MTVARQAERSFNHRCELVIERSLSGRQKHSRTSSRCCGDLGRLWLEAGIDRVASEGQVAEYAFVDPAEGVLADKLFKGFKTMSKLAKRQMAFG